MAIVGRLEGQISRINELSLYTHGHTHTLEALWYVPQSCSDPLLMANQCSFGKLPIETIHTAPMIRHAVCFVRRTLAEMNRCFPHIALPPDSEPPFDAAA